VEEIAQVYARSLFAVAKEQDRLDEIKEQLAEFSKAVEESRDLSLFFFSPYFTTQEKKDGLDKALDDADDTFRNFLGVLLDNHRMPVIHRVRRAYDELWAEEHKLLPVDVTTAIELEDDVVKRIGERVGEQTGKEIELNAHVDPDIIGGIVLRVGNSVLDASIRNRLDQLRRHVARV
jgi:F-type H+-transporting ATPase subunit delta